MLHRGSLVTADADSISFEPEYYLVLLVVSDLVTLLVILSKRSQLPGKNLLSAIGFGG